MSENNGDYFGMGPAFPNWVAGDHMPESKLYYECHITIEPVFDERLALADCISDKNYFRVADLLMQKRHEDLPTRSKFDTFMTGRHKNDQILRDRMLSTIKDLQSHGFVVWRYKIEDTICDSKLDDLYKVIPNDNKI